MAIDPDDFFDEEGNIRRRDNLVVTLCEGDLLIDFDEELYIIREGNLNIHTSGIRTGDGIPTHVPQEEAGEYISQSYGSHATIFNMTDLGLNREQP